MQCLKLLSACLFWLNVRFLIRNVEYEQLLVCHFWLHLGRFSSYQKFSTSFSNMFNTHDLITMHVIKFQSCGCIFSGGIHSKFRILIMLLCSIRKSDGFTFSTAMFEGQLLNWLNRLLPNFAPSARRPDKRVGKVSISAVTCEEHNRELYFSVHRCILACIS